MAHQLLDMCLDLGPELLVGTHQQPEEVAEELRDGAVLHVLAPGVLQRARHAAPPRVPAAGGGGGLLLEADSAQRHEEAGHDEPPLGVVARHEIRVDVVSAVVRVGRHLEVLVEAESVEADHQEVHHKAAVQHNEQD